MIGILIVGVALGGLGGKAYFDLSAQMDWWFTALSDRLGAVKQRQARMEGLIEGAGLFSRARQPARDSGAALP